MNTTYKYGRLTFTFAITDNDLMITITDDNENMINYEDLTEDEKEFRYNSLLKFMKM